MLCSFGHFWPDEHNKELRIDNAFVFYSFHAFLVRATNTRKIPFHRRTLSKKGLKQVIKTDLIRMPYLLQETSTIQ